MVDLAQPDLLTQTVWSGLKPVRGFPNIALCRSEFSNSLDSRSLNLTEMITNNTKMFLFTALVVNSGTPHILVILAPLIDPDMLLDLFRHQSCFSLLLNPNLTPVKTN